MSTKADMAAASFDSFVLAILCCQFTQVRIQNLVPFNSTITFEPWTVTF